jgi:hypothetical protein
VDERQALVDLPLEVLAILPEAAVAHLVEHDQALLRTGRDRDQAAVAEERAQDPRGLDRLSIAVVARLAVARHRRSLAATIP